MKKFGRRKTTRLQSKVNIRQFDTRALIEDFHAHAEQVMKNAAVVFVQEACKNVPSLTGQSKAALIQIAEGLGINPGVTPDSPPISENMHLYYKLVEEGNTVARGKTLSFSSIEKNDKQVILSIKFSIFSARNGFGYFTYWDNNHWHSIEEANRSMRDFVRNNIKPPRLRTKNG